MARMRGESWPGSPGIRAANVAFDERDKVAWEALSEEERQRITASLLDES